MPRRLFYALAGSALVHASLLSLLGAEAVTGQGRHALALDVTLQPKLARVALQPAPPAPLPTQPGMAEPQPAAPVTPPTLEAPATPAAEPVEVALVSSLPSAIAVFGGTSDTTWYTSEEVDVAAESLVEVRVDTPLDMGHAKLDGRVKVAVYVDEFGVTDRVEVVESTADEILNNLAIGAFRRAVWQPAMLEGRRVRNLKQIEVCFGRCDATPLRYKEMIEVIEPPKP
ncbi:TonB family protein [Chitinimonas viridis]|uniref:TonB family protein n=1 Tax=Chitinimonas viridis TaxID=664880 RepID=A0ABT8B524_9NEIS|nr:TonB family protein [Chitinimonas viridis]MDN3576736.1 TonB family protein [Chitinimonas viridis]